MINNPKQKDCMLIHKSLMVFSDKLLAIAYSLCKAKQSNSTNVSVKEFIDYYNEALKFIVSNSTNYIE